MVESWTETTLEELCIPGGLVRGPFGGALKKEIFVSSGYKVYEQRNAIYATTEIGSYYITGDKYRELSRFAIADGDFIVSCSGTIGCIYQLPVKSPEGVINQALLKITLDPQKIDTELFLQYFRSEFFRKSIIDDTQGGAMKNLVGMDKFRKALFVIPSDSKEQRAIAAALSDADAYILGLEKLIAKKRAVKQGAMQELLTGKRRLSGFKGEWVDDCMENYLKFEVGYPFSSTFFNSSQGMRLVKNRDLKSDDQIYYTTENYDEIYIVEDGDVLVGMDGDFIPCLWNKGPALLNQRVGRVRTNQNMALLFAYYILLKPLEQLQNGTGATTVKHLSHSNVEKLIVRIPKDVAEQMAIAAVLSNMDSEIDALTAKRKKAWRIKQGMMSELLTGRIRLIEEDTDNGEN